MSVGNTLNILDHDPTEQTAALQIAERIPVRSGMSGADFQNATALEFHVQDEMVCHGIALCSANRNGNDRPVMNAVHEIAFGERRDGFFPGGRSDERIGRSAFARGASRRTGSIGIGRMASEHIADGSGDIAAEFPGHAAIGAAACSGWAALSAIARRRLAHAIIAIRRCRIAFLSASAAIVDVVVQIRARVSAAGEIAETARTAPGASHAAGAARRSTRPALATRSHRAAIATGAGCTGRTRRRLTTALAPRLDIGAAPGNGQAQQAENENVVLHEIEIITTSRRKTNRLS